MSVSTRESYSSLAPLCEYAELLHRRHHFLKNGGHAVISIKASCIDSTAPAEVVFAAEVKKMQAEMFKPREQLTLEPYERDHAMVVATYNRA